MANRIISCPECGNQFELDNVLESAIRNEIQEEVNSKAEEQERAFQQRDSALKDQELQLEAREKDLSEQVKRELGAKEKELRQSINTDMQREYDARQTLLQNTIDEKSEQLLDAQLKELELRQDRQKLEEEKQGMQLEIVRQLDQERKKIAAEATQKAVEAQELKLREREDQIRRMQEQIDLLKRRSDTGSQEAQGEALEGILLERLQRAFLSDTFEEISRGQRGADIIQTVHNPAGKACGKILWEAKNAQNFSHQWVDKLKDNLQRADANIPVLVTMAMPNGITRCHHYNDVWVSELPSAIGLSMALRQILIQVEREKLVTAGQESLKDLVYDYFTSPEFANRIKSIAGAYQQMMYDLDREKSAMERLWGKRERQIKTVVKQLAGMQGEIEGMAGSEKALQHIEVFELETAEDLKEE